MRDLEKGKPFKNGYMRAKIVACPVKIKDKDRSLIMSILCQDEILQHFELMAFNLGQKADFNKFFSELDCGMILQIKQPYMKVNKRGHFMLRNDILSNLKIEHLPLNMHEFYYDQAEIFYKNGLYARSEKCVKQGYDSLRNDLRAVGPYSWIQIR